MQLITTISFGIFSEYCYHSVAQLCQILSTPWTAAHQAPLSLTISQSLLKFVSIELVLLSNQLILCHPLLLLPSVLPSIRVFPDEPALCIRWPEYYFRVLPSHCCCSVAKLCLTLFDPTDCSTPGFPVHPLHPKLAQTQVH